MFVGDLEAPPAPPAPRAPTLALRVPEPEPQAAALLPQDLRVVVEGWSSNRVPALAALVTVFLLVGLAVQDAPSPGGRVSFLAATVAVCVLVGWLGNRLFVRHRGEYRLTDEGIELNVWHLVDRRPWVTRIPWTEIEHYTASIDHHGAVLRVDSVRGCTLLLRDRPPRLSTREFIRRFVDQAERHPRAVAAGPVSAVPAQEAEAVPPAEIPPQFAVGCGYLTLGTVGMALQTAVELSTPQRVAGWTGLGVIGIAAFTWNQLTDSDLAHTDRASRKLMARVRRWLRRVLGIRII
jgi:hypothetical protein